jgi:poly(3-hydroxybutyrate) depolymerase
MRKVYPGFLQLSGFMAMNYDRHATAHQEFYQHLVDGDGDSAEKHREFYDEYLAVMDLTAEFYLQTVETVFVKHLLPNGLMTHRGRPVRTETIRRTALLTIEGERDDISGVGQTKAAQTLCSNLPYEMRQHYLAMGVGHYGVFNGSRYRSEIQPRIADFIAKHDAKANGAKTNGREQASKPINGKHPPLGKRLADGLGITALAGKSPDEVAQGMTAELTDIVGIGPKIAADLNEAGIFEIDQLAEMTADAMRALDEQMKGRPNRDDWFGQAKKLTNNGG